jgi:type IV pilus assembly protein PilC
MNYEQLAFTNQQLAGMLKAGIPLEGALQQVCQNMSRGALRDELQKLQADLTQGIPLPQALATRRLPEFYRQMIEVGVRGNDLPGVLTLLADYYRRAGTVWTRLQGLMVYPLIVLVAAICLSFFLLLLQRQILKSFFVELMEQGVPPHLSIPALFVPAALALAALAVVALFCLPKLRRNLRWRLPGFREASLSQLAAAAEMMLRKGVPFSDALKFLHQLERHTVAGDELVHWQERMAEGNGKIQVLAADSRVIPPLFVWIVANAGEDLAGGFRDAAEIYYNRASAKIEMLLVAALPISILALGLLIPIQILPVVSALVRFLDMLGGQ